MSLLLAVIQNEKFWQIILLVLTVYFTNYVNFLFQTKKDSRKELREHVSNLNRVGFLLSKALYAWYESSIYAEFYSLKNVITPHKDYWDEHLRLIRAQSTQAEKAYELYAETKYLITQIEKLVPENQFKKIDSLSKTIFFEWPFEIQLPKNIDAHNLEKITAWKDERIRDIKDTLHSKITIKFDSLITYLKSIN